MDLTRLLVAIALFITLFGGVTIFFAAPVLAQCPMCKAALDSDDPAAAGLGAGFSWGTLVLAPAPFVLLGLMGVVLWRSNRKARLPAERG